MSLIGRMLTKEQRNGIIWYLRMMNVSNITGKEDDEQLIYLYNYFQTGYDN